MDVCKIFCTCLFIVHKIISLSRDEQVPSMRLRFERYFSGQQQETYYNTKNTTAFPNYIRNVRLIMASYWYHLKSLFVLKYSYNCGCCNGWNSIFNHNRHLHVGQYTYSIFNHNRHLHVGQCMYRNIYNTTPSKRLGTTSWWRWFHSYTCIFGKMFASHQHFLSKQ